jgi:hypothetical protein
MAACNFASSELFSTSILDGIENKNRGWVEAKGK